MARQTRGPLRLDLSPIVRTMGMEWVLEQLGAKRVIGQLGAKRVIEELGGVTPFLEELGGMKQLVAELSPGQRRELKRLLQE